MKAKARIVLKQEVAKIINWLTRNYDNEIGAIGLGEMKEIDGYPSIYIEELLFPEQEVTSATVSIKPESWVKLRKEHGADKLNRMMFYWHRHPDGSAHHSGTDEEDTFGSFMSDKSKRKYFAFLQTAESDGKIVHEARIDLREPIRVTIEDKDIELITELTDEDKKLIEFCEKTIEEKVTEKKTTTVYWNSNYNHKTDNVTKNEKAISQLFEKDTEEELKVALHFNGEGDGMVYIVADKDLTTKLDYELGDSIAGVVDTFIKKPIENTDGWWKYNLTPTKDKYKAMKHELKRIHKEYLQFMNEKKDDLIAGINDNQVIEIQDNLQQVNVILEGLYSVGYLVDVSSGDGNEVKQLITYEGKDVIGDVVISDYGKSLTIIGKELIELLSEYVEEVEEVFVEDKKDVKEPKEISVKADKSETNKKKNGGKIK